MDPIRTLVEQDEKLSESLLPADLRTQYGGDLRFPSAAAERLYVANFVSTLDGVVSYDVPGQSGGAQISGANEGDRFIMGLLRASADAVLVGGGTVERSRPRISGSRNLSIQPQVMPTPVTGKESCKSRSTL